jgi:hypothetical protein
MSKENEIKTSNEQVVSQAGQLSESQLEAVAGGIVITGGKAIIDDDKRDTVGDITPGGITSVGVR